MSNLIAPVLIPSARTMLGYADRLLVGITPDNFARMPKGVETNHPAFNFGHLAIYPEPMLRTLGRDDLAIDESHYADIFGMKSQCKDDPEGNIYPHMTEVVERFRTRHEVVLGVLAETDDEVFGKTNPVEGMRERFPTIGAMTAFMLGGHAMMHLGQISAWRRCMGLGSAM
ncbi:MAG: DinB family protein [Phycisphaeraceae bacterium]|nr:MAG: DinB family protein [Phycisphaeraceae bacterium]